MPSAIFYSWQSDIRPGAACRTFIQQALEAAVEQLAHDGSLAVEPVLDRDTQDIPGCPDIDATILAKIDAAAVFVADVTLVGKTDAGKALPNPNVLIELGYALKALGTKRIVLVQNTAFGGPDLLPFDLRQKRVLTYSSPADAPNRSEDRKRLQARLVTALGEILRIPAPPAEVAISIDYTKKQITQEVHVYELVVRLVNQGRRRLDDWEIEILFPTQLLGSTVYGIKVADRSNAETSLFLVDGRKLKEPLRPGADRTIRIEYVVTNDTYSKWQDLFARRVTARALIDGTVAAESDKSIDELQCF